VSAAHQPLRAMVDSCAIDHFVTGAKHSAELNAAIADGRLEIIGTHVQRTEVAPSAFVLGLSRIGIDRLGEGTIHTAITTAPKHAEDGLIADTAAHEGLILVTEDDRLWKRANALGVPTYRIAELLVQLRAAKT
jgi:hypothetical protein